MSNETTVVPALEADRTYCEGLQKTLGTKSATIRYLTAEGWPRGRIAKGMDVIYQHVRNVQTQQLKKPVTPEMTESDLGL